MELLERQAVRHMQLMHWDGSRFEAILFEGGGTKGMVYAGAMRRLEEAGLVGSLRCFGGTSAGAQTAVMMAIGYTGNELRDIMASAPWDHLLDKSTGCCSLCRDLVRLKREYGICRGEFLLEYLEELIEAKVGRRDITIQELYDERGVEVRLGACNVTRKCFQLLDRQSHPRMPLALAARASSSIPWVFAPVRYRDEKGRESLYVDGGLAGNLPARCFPGRRTLAFNLMSTRDYNALLGDAEEQLRSGLGGFSTALLDMVLCAAQAQGGVNDREIRAPQVANVDFVLIDCGDAGMLDTHMSEEQIGRMVAAGYDAVSDYLQR